jgi:hypothetical protein
MLFSQSHAVLAQVTKINRYCDVMSSFCFCHTFLPICPGDCKALRTLPRCLGQNSGNICNSGSPVFGLDSLVL